QDEKVNIAKALTYPTKIKSIFSFLGFDPNRFSMNQSYSFSFTTIGGKTLGQGLYLNTMSYRLANPLTMYLQIGFVNQPFGSLREYSNFNNKLFISGAGLEYKPSENFKVQFEFSQTPGGLYYNSYHHRPFYDQTPWWEKKDKKNN
ncbi:MAG: hypothetical protein D6813_09395, partial [Calditrichaeota bacterium]